MTEQQIRALLSKVEDEIARCENDPFILRVPYLQYLKTSLIVAITGREDLETVLLYTRRTIEQQTRRLEIDYRFWIEKLVEKELL